MSSSDPHSAQVSDPSPPHRHGNSTTNTSAAPSFVDVYVDDDQTTLTSIDCWLRRRDDKWELKLNAQRLRELTSQSSSSSSSDRATSVDLSRYEDYTDEKEILQFLQTIYSAATDSSPHISLVRSLLAEVQRKNLPQSVVAPAAAMNWDEFWKTESSPSSALTTFLHEKQIKPIVAFTTKRRAFEFQPPSTATAPPPPPLPSELKDIPLQKCHIVLDEADYSPPSTISSPQNASNVSAEQRFFRVAEVEMVFDSPSSEDQELAERQISDFVTFLRKATGVPEEEEETKSNNSSGSSEVKLPRGKVERYLALFRPWHFELLRKLKEAAQQQKKLTI